MSESDVAIAGGGLAGLSLAISLAQRGWRVSLFEQKRYPFHRVCGEYIALESWPRLLDLGLDLAPLHLPRITRLQVTAPRGPALTSALKPGGFGISRYRLDALLAERAQAVGVQLYTGVRVRQLVPEAGHFRVETDAGTFGARLACGAFGKYSQLDRSLRPDQLPQGRGVPTWTGIKYHLRTRFPADLIALHNFPGGYCGISQVEAERVCCCYLVRQEAVEAAGGISALEATALAQNPYLASIWAQAEPLWERPQAIAQVHFAARSLIENHVIMLGDAAGLIPPLCGNGMSMAFESSALLTPLLNDYLGGSLSRAELERAYTRTWRQRFGVRLQTGRLLQHGFGRSGAVRALLTGLQLLPGLHQPLIALTHEQASPL